MIEIKTEGLNRAMALMKTLKAKPRIKGITLNAKDRHDANDLNNNQIAEWLEEGGRDFFSADDQMVKLFDAAMVEAMEKKIKQLLKRIPKKDPKQGKLTLRNEKHIREANVIATAGFRAAMKVYTETVTDRINTQKTADGGKPTKLTPEYEKRKNSKHGFVIPIGVATGQLLDNFAPGSRNIKLTK